MLKFPWSLNFPVHVKGSVSHVHSINWSLSMKGLTCTAPGLGLALHAMSVFHFMI